MEPNVVNGGEVGPNVEAKELDVGCRAGYADMFTSGVIDRDAGCG